MFSVAKVSKIYLFALLVKKTVIPYVRFFPLHELLFYREKFSSFLHDAHYISANKKKRQLSNDIISRGKKGGGGYIYSNRWMYLQ